MLSSVTSLGSGILRRVLKESVFRHTANLTKMVDAKLEAVPLVDIDEGVFKYILIKVYGKETKDGCEPCKLIVRGYNRAQWHSDIYNEVVVSVKELGLESKCLGGGKIEHKPDKKTIRVFGESTGFGKADHAETKHILQSKFKDYEIETE